MRRPSEQAPTPRPPTRPDAPGGSAGTPGSSYDVPADFDPAVLREGLGGAVSLSPGSWTRLTQTYFDSFDWRLHKRGTVLIEQRSGAQSEIFWRSLDSGATLAQMTGQRIPRFVADLPLSPLRERLRASLNARALFPAVGLETRQCVTEVRDAREKVVARLIQESWHAIRIPIRGLPAPRNQDVQSDVAATPQDRTQIRLEPVRGYEKAAQRLEKALRAAPGIVPQPSEVLTRALAEIGRFPGDYSSKLRLVLTADLRSDQALRKILQRPLETLEAALPGLRADLDRLFLQNFRVAVRRARSALGQLKGVLPSDRTKPVRTELAWLGRASGPLRDLDVCLLSFDDYRASLDADQQPNIEPLRGFLRQRRTAALKDLRRILRSRRFNRLIADWRELASQPVDRRPENLPEAPRAAQSAQQLGAESIARAYKKVLKAGAKIGPKSPAVALHDLRKDCKKLRYLMEFFRSLYPEQDIKSAIKVLKTLQENLGAYQDFEAHQDHLRGFDRDMSQAGLMTPATHEAISVLVQQLDERQSATREIFAGRYKAFVAKENRQLFARLFAPASTPGAKAGRKGGGAGKGARS